MKYLLSHLCVVVCLCSITINSFGESPTQPKCAYSCWLYPIIDGGGSWYRSPDQFIPVKDNLGKPYPSICDTEVSYENTLYTVRVSDQVGKDTILLIFEKNNPKMTGVTSIFDSIKGRFSLIYYQANMRLVCKR